jgi:hypothetical protein
METSLMSHFTRNATLAAVAFAMVGSTVFGGAALATDYGKDKKAFKKEVTKVIFKGGNGGWGGDADTDCVTNVIGAVTLGTGPADEPVIGSNYCPAFGGDANGAPAIDGTPGENA